MCSMEYEIEAMWGAKLLSHKLSIKKNKKRKVRGKGREERKKAIEFHKKRLPSDIIYNIYYGYYDHSYIISHHIYL